MHACALPGVVFVCFLASVPHWWWLQFFEWVDGDYNKFAKLERVFFPPVGRYPTRPDNPVQPQSACLYYASARARNGSQDAAIENHSAQVCTLH